LVSPALDIGAVTVTAYFPAGDWFDFYTVSFLQLKKHKRVFGPAAIFKNTENYVIILLLH
jgi:hypothetical protein